MKKAGLIFILISFVISAFGQTDIQYKITVAQDGSGDFTTIQSAIDAAKAFPDKRITIFVKNGIYREKIVIPSWNNMLSLIGEDAGKTIITGNDYFNKINRGRNSTFFTYTVLVQADDFYAENLTIENTAGEVGQAVALHVEGDRCVFNNCRILGNQDTLYVSGEKSRHLFNNCYIEGTTDFIFGSATAVFTRCEIVAKSNSYITAASTSEGKEFGFVFLNCKLNSTGPATEVYLGRPWRNYAKTVFLNCFLGKHILPEGWHNWSKPEAEKLSFYAEFNNSGPGASTAKRVSWSHVLQKNEAEKYTPENILGGWISAFPVQ